MIHRLARCDFCGWEKSVQIFKLWGAQFKQQSLLNFLLYSLQESLCLGKNESILICVSTCYVAGFYFIFLVLMGRIRQMSPSLCRNPFHVMVFLNKQVNWCSSLTLKILKQQFLKVYFEYHSGKNPNNKTPPKNQEVKTQTTNSTKSCMALFSEIVFIQFEMHKE